MDSGQLQAICELIVQGARFLSVYARDRIPSLATSVPQFPCCFIANTDKASGPGEHWVAYFLQSPDNIEFFDSFALTPGDYGFSLQASTRNTVQIQSDSSDHCGHFCVYYLFHRALGQPLQFLIRDFSPTYLLLNDRKVEHFVAPYLYPDSYCALVCRCSSSSTNPTLVYQTCKCPACFDHMHAHRTRKTVHK